MVKHLFVSAKETKSVSEYEKETEALILQVKKAQEKRRRDAAEKLKIPPSSSWEQIIDEKIRIIKSSPRWKIRRIFSVVRRAPKVMVKKTAAVFRPLFH